uniref:Uncharacterized protein n=1 Tax=Periophthalmus magnuspinnatus TaxID=409849 RepID=A0A3B4A9Z5_9GOBI
MGFGGCSLQWIIPPGVFNMRRLLYALTSMCSRVKTTGSLMKTRLDSLLIEATSLAILIVAFSVLRNCPRFLYRTKTSLATPTQKEVFVFNVANSSNEVYFRV